MYNYCRALNQLRGNSDVTSITFALYNASTSRYARVRSVEVENADAIADIRTALRNEITTTYTLSPADMRIILKTVTHPETRLGLIRLLASLELQQVDYPNAIHAIGLRVNR